MNRALEGLARAHDKLGNLRRPSGITHEASILKRRLGDERGAASILASLAMAAERQGLYRDALSFERQAIGIRDREGDRMGVAECSVTVWASSTLSSATAAKACASTRRRSPSPRQLMETSFSATSYAK